ncbi:hypothetical protein AB0E78_02825 [Streptomyces sp. NPDC032198]|uniref:hypothetical protein n=1 Tax=Streptomyces sp. NPDC032198 TaxID=3155127 RepID=UPI0034079230
MAALKRSANGKQLLLLTALLFGIVTMHTLGHPTGHSPSSTASVATHSSSAAADLSASHDRGPEQDVGRHQMSETGATGATTVSASGATASDPAMPGMDGMDPLSVCLAVLAALTLVLLLKAGLLRPGGFAVPVRPLARLLDGLRPNPPPPRILLSRLSVLRI